MTASSASLLLLVSSVAGSLAALAPFERPTIGVLTFPVDDNATAGPSTVDAAYVKWLEQAGAAVSPILYNSSAPALEAQFATLNGVLFTGGPKRPTDFPRYLSAARTLPPARPHARRDPEALPAQIRLELAPGADCGYVAGHARRQRLLLHPRLLPCRHKKRHARIRALLLPPLLRRRLPRPRASLSPSANRDPDGHSRR